MREFFDSTKITNVLLKLSRGNFDDLVGREKRDQTIQFRVNGLTSKVAYLAAWPKEEVYRAYGLDEISVQAPQPMKYFRFEVDMKDPEGVPVKISQIHAAAKAVEEKPNGK